MPTTVGTVLEYDWTGARGHAEVTLRLERAQAHGENTTLVWSIETRSEWGVQRVRLDRECGPDGAEEPWLGLGVPEIARLSDQDWRLPRQIAPGRHYGGTYHLALAGIDTPMLHMYEVESDEVLTIDHMPHNTTRIAIEESTPGAAEPFRGVQWLERGVGLVRLDLAIGTSSEATYQLRRVVVPVE